MAVRKHIAIVVHGSRSDRPDFRHLCSWVRGRGHWLTVHVTFAPGDAEYHAQRAAIAGADVVAAAGGDGTLNEVVVGSSRVDLQACKLEYSIVSPK